MLRNATGAIASVLRLTDGLGHGSHRTVYTPRTWFIQNHGNESQDSGCEHHAVKTKGKLRYPRCYGCTVICPIPRQFDGPEKCDHFFQISCAFEYQIGAKKHIEKHDEKENQKSITEPFAPQEFGDIFFRESPSLLPSRSKSCPLPQNLLQYILSPPKMAMSNGMKKHSSPIHAKRILKNPKIK